MAALFYSGFAVLMAALEVEIEGPFGWAERLPTWYRCRGAAARIYGMFMGGRPLTGYHCWVFLLSLYFVHAGLLRPPRWTLIDEVTALSRYFVLAVQWDFLWFVLNPVFGWKGFRRERIWWHCGRWWGRFPRDYYLAVFIAVSLSGVEAFLQSSLVPLCRYLIYLAETLFITLCFVLVARWYRRWHRWMRRPGADDRPLAGICHPSDPDR